MEIIGRRKTYKIIRRGRKNQIIRGRGSRSGIK
jgi:hypothetical protein